MQRKHVHTLLYSIIAVLFLLTAVSFQVKASAAAPGENLISSVSTVSGSSIDASISENKITKNKSGNAIPADSGDSSADQTAGYKLTAAAVRNSDSAVLIQEVKLNGDLGDSPACVTPGSGMSFEMEKYMRKMNPDVPFPSVRILELNPEHAAVQAMQSAMVGDTQKAKDYAALLYGQALLMADLPLEDPTEFGKLVCKLMK